MCVCVYVCVCVLDLCDLDNFTSPMTYNNVHIYLTWEDKAVEKHKPTLDTERMVLSRSGPGRTGTSCVSHTGRSAPRGKHEAGSGGAGWS